MENIDRLAKLIKDVESMLAEKKITDTYDKIIRQKFSSIFDIVRNYYKELENDKIQIQNKLQAYFDKLNIQMNEISTISETMLTTKNKEINHLKIKLDEFRKHIDELNDELEENSKDFEILKELVEKVTNENDIIKAENDQLKNTNHHFKEEMIIVEKKINKLKETISKNPNMSKLFNIDNHTLEDSKNNPKNESCLANKNLGIFIDALQQHICSLEKYNTDVEERNQQLKTNINQLMYENQNSSVKLSSTTEKVQLLEKELSNKHEINKQLTTEIEQLKNDKNKLELLRSQAESINRENSNTIQSQKLQLDELQKQINSFKSNNLNSSGSKNITESQNKDIKVRFDERIDHLKKIIFENEKIIKQQQEELHDHKAMLNARKKSNENQIKIINTYKEEIIKLKKELNKANEVVQQKFEPFKIKNKEYEQEIIALNNQVNMLITELQKVKDESFKLNNASFDSLNNMKNTFLKNEEILKCRVKTLETDLKNYNKIQEKIKEYQNKIKKLKADNKRLITLSNGKDCDQLHSYNIKIIEMMLDNLKNGNIECDKRFCKMIEKTIQRLELYDDPALCKLAVQFSLCKKYVDEVIKIREEFEKYMNINKAKT